MPVQSQSLLQPVSPLPAPSPYTGPIGGLAERQAPASRPASPARPACTSRRTSRPRPPAVPGTHQMALRPSTAPLRVPLPSPPATSLPAFPDPESDSLRAVSPTVARFLATVVTDPSLASTAASALVAELVDFAASCRLDYAASEAQSFPSLSPASSSAVALTSGMGLVLGGRRPVVLTGHADASWADDQATQRSSQGYTFSLGSGSVSWRSTRSSSVLSSSCEAEIYAGAMAAQELRWLTYLLTDLGEQPRSPPVLYVDNKAMLVLCREHRLEHRTKHIALRYFLARELQQRGQLRLAYVASEANTADIFTKALAPGDHQRFCTLLGTVGGFDQTHGIDYTLTFAPVSRHTSVRLVLCEAAAKNLPLRQIDVSNAFLYADVDAEIYVEYPHTYPTNPPSVGKLKKSLYGIKQAPRLWQQHLNRKLTEVGFQQLPHDPGMYWLDDKGSYALLVAYVDDILYVSSSTSLGDRIEADLKKSLDLTIFTKVTQFLGLNVSRTSSAIHLTASKYAESLAKRFNISTDFVATPYRSTLTGHVPNLKNMSPAGLQLYQQQLGCLLFAAVTCRPDLAYAASHLAQFLRCPKEEHSLDLQRALRYFVSTPTIGLIFNTGKPTDKMYLSGYVDADHAGDTSDRRSRTGYIFRLEPIGPISWNSSKQKLVSLSSTEAEFIAACAATREGQYLPELLDEAKFVMPNQFTLQCDNQSAITIANKPGFVNRTKHISLRYFFVKDATDKGRMRLVYCPTSDMAADSLTKKLTRQKFHHCNQLSGLSESTG
ncbi:unnamed protein product [Closterium sp. NIES-53]